MEKMAFVLSMVFLGTFLLLGTGIFIQHGLSGFKKASKRIKKVMGISLLLYVISFAGWILLQSTS